MSATKNKNPPLPPPRPAESANKACFMNIETTTDIRFRLREIAMKRHMSLKDLLTELLTKAAAE